MQAILKQIGYQKVDSIAIAFGVAPRINACGRMGDAYKALDLLLESDYEKALKEAEEIQEYNDRRQAEEKIIFEEACNQIDSDLSNKDAAIVVGGNLWHRGVIGIVASKITDKYYKPTILIGFDDETNLGKGSGRSIQGFNLHEALTKCKDTLAGFGGHSMAVGVSVTKENFDNFKTQFNKIASLEGVNNLEPTLNIDSVINIDEITKNMVQSLSLLEPFGEANKMPIFAFKNLRIDSIRSLSDGKHLKLTLKSRNNNFINAIGFNLGYLADDYRIGERIDVAGNLEINSFNGNETVQINIKDVMGSL